jgi:GNAT superfamily N-acetyltransferase
MRYIPVYTNAGIETLASIARTIWDEYWTDRIGAEQTAYMVEKYQSVPALTEAIRTEGYLYFFLVEDERIVGYFGVRPEEREGKLFLSKLYLFAEERDQGYSSKTMQFLVQLCRRNDLGSIYLTVNKFNDLAIRAYQASGFEIVDSVETDIGSGFIMDDYIMEKRL